MDLAQFFDRVHHDILMSRVARVVKDARVLKLIRRYLSAGVKGIFEELDGWIRRHVRKIVWRQWKRRFTRAKRLMGLGIAQARAWHSATNGRGPWWNAGASHVNQALPKRFFDRLGFLSLMDEYHRLIRAS